MTIATKSKGVDEKDPLGVEHRKICEIPSTTSKVISAHVDLPYIGNTRSAYVNAFEFEHVTLVPRKFYPTPNFPPVGLRAPGGLTLSFAPNF